jgi:sugar lactone lactonase YvrE
MTCEANDEIMQHPTSMIRIALAALVLGTTASVAAVTTNSFKLDSADAFFQGELENTAVHSEGAVRLGAATERTELANVPLAYSVAHRGDTSFIGTGTTGAVYRVEGKVARKFADTGELVVSSLAFGRDGALYAGTLPNGRIYRIDPKSGATKRFAQPEGAKHVWALLYDRKRGKLLAGTGPEGTIFSVDSVGQAKPLYRAEGSHVMSLASDGRGDVLAGTSDSALLLRIGPDGRAHVVRDLPGNEVSAIDVIDGRIAVAVNQFKGAPGAQFKAPAPAPRKPGAGPRPRPGSGQLWRIEPDGRAEMLLARKDTHFTDVQWGEDGAVFVAGGNEGRIFKVDPDASYSIWADVEERQVLALDLRSNRPLFVTGDGGAVYRVLAGRPKSATWTSAALDARFPSSWGRLSWRGEGRFVFQTRSGNTKDPGETWSDWSKDLKAPGRIASPGARFIQVRATFPKDATAELRAIELFYLRENQRARVHDVQGERPPSKRNEQERHPPPPTTLVKVSWNIDNPDGDPLRYRLSYRADAQSLWREMFDEERVLTEAQYIWNTESIPDGHYIIRVEASDEEANPSDLTLRSVAVSEPISVDNHPPRIDELKVHKGRLRGRVVDALGPIARIQISMDAGPWRDIFPSDSLLDTGDERFELGLGELEAGSHILSVRAFDRAGNQANREITAKIR